MSEALNEDVEKSISDYRVKKRKAYKKKWYESNVKGTDKERKRCHEYYLAHKDQILERNRKRRLRKKENQIGK